MKKRGKEKAEFESNLKYGVKGLKVSLIIAIFIWIFLTLLLCLKISYKNVLLHTFSAPNQPSDWMAVLSGIILFIAVPFLIGIAVRNRKNNKIESKKWYTKKSR